MLHNVSQEERALCASSLTPDEAKARVLDHWHQLDALAQRRFPRDQNLAHEGLLYVLKHLEAEDWQRVRTWQGSGQFLPFLSTLAARLLMDFARTRFGHIRRPAWLAEKQDPLWETAYRLLVVERWSRQEVIEQLLLSRPERERWFIDEVVSTIRTRCSDQALAVAPPADAGLEQADERGGPDLELMIQDKEMVEALQGYLQGEGNSDASACLRVSELLARLRGLLDLTEEDRLLLRLRYRDGLTMPAIVRLLQLEGDPYKRVWSSFHEWQEIPRKARARDGLVRARGNRHPYDDPLPFGRNPGPIRRGCPDRPGPGDTIGSSQSLRVLLPPLAGGRLLARGWRTGGYPSGAERFIGARVAVSPTLVDRLETHRARRGHGGLRLHHDPVVAPLPRSPQ
jgi:hypothetical protein